jgi:antitoxin (DNA-binding transcriptional repressor) of toxin-antitoxin stability system
MQIIDVNQAKLHLPELIEQTISGDEIVIAQDGKALVKLVALVKPGKASPCRF